VINQRPSNILDVPLNCQRKSGVVQGYVKRYNFNWFDWFCLWYPPGWLILFNRHWQRYHEDPDGWNWLEYGLFFFPLGFYLALLIRWLRLGCRSPRSNVTEFDPNYQELFRQEILAPIVKKYFRAELEQIENLPSTEPMMVVMNHAGMCFPWDFICLGYLLSEARGWVVQPLANVSLFEHPWVVWWLPPKWSNVLGGISAKLDTFEAAIQAHKTILYAPEGVRGPQKGWQNRYQLQTFDVSFINLSQRYQVPILPVICMGSENLNPFAVNIRKIQRLLKLPFLPISPLMIVFALFPSMGVWAMRPRKGLRYYIQKLKFSNNHVDDLDNKRQINYQQAQELRQAMQSEINRLLA
jgi:1-acyl-sn-glycerol-3-phosphate acyltransferase